MATWENQLQRREAVYAELLEEVHSFLAPEQVETLARWQTNQIRLERLGMEMARLLAETNRVNLP